MKVEAALGHNIHRHEISEIIMDIGSGSQSAEQFESLISETLKYELHIENNRIHARPGQNQVGYDRVYKVYARNNIFDLISVENFPKNSSFLDLSHNELTKMNYDDLKYLNKFNKFNKLMLENISMACDCKNSDDILEFYIFMKY